ncbi:MAG TPA: AtpZ/AtpI family protein [Deltaproteobacteria bacterium]|jgi:F0F1-type ATP synthase assembly protein I|nr:AtpZ/AtpI family protein [Deltaproteobacteria bacterium]HQI02673.1 AtpZ/AtpI family protein [Deltaproteobacteria bacterium]HQJ09437.1 AtpZ/AtpI family protein [Deltaproteobacteria bacterium]
MVKQKRRPRNDAKDFHHIMMMSAWGFTIVVSSFLFLSVGRWIDVKIGTEPAFMIGLFILGIGLCIGRMYTDYIRTKEHLGKYRYQA